MSKLGTEFPRDWFPAWPPSGDPAVVQFRTEQSGGTILWRVERAIGAMMFEEESEAACDVLFNAQQMIKTLKGIV